MESGHTDTLFMNDCQRSELIRLCPNIRWNVDMATYSTFRAGGTVEALVDINAIDKLKAVLRYLHAQQIPWNIVGGGSNILVSRRCHVGVFIRLRSSIREITRRPLVTAAGERCCLRVHAGCTLASLIGWCIHNNVSGLEFMAGIPGSVGGAIRMNAGAFGHAIGEVLSSVQIMDGLGNVEDVPREKVSFTYRSSRFPGEPADKVLITSGEFCLQPADGREVARRCREIIGLRRGSQPKGVGSAGSFFKNPEGDFAGRLIEQAGLKGLRIGRAMVSVKHANFIVNTGGAAPDDIIRLMEEVQRHVLQHSGVLLEPEVHIY